MNFTNNSLYSIALFAAAKVTPFLTPTTIIELILNSFFVVKTNTKPSYEPPLTRLVVNNCAVSGVQIYKLLFVIQQTFYKYFFAFKYNSTLFHKTYKLLNNTHLYLHINQYKTPLSGLIM